MPQVSRLLNSKSRLLSRHSGMGAEGVHCILPPSAAPRGLRERLHCTGRALHVVPRAPLSRPATLRLRYIQCSLERIDRSV
ncbi:hypothetical protein E2C01_095120 [Portunus trituberculatus]|uniref:Uncharacterized protein n=1 Tax=Portunus trituberculatus TaxID=210409 RepID=A0A5B7JUH3_PORTR|nr:hypothetical protein [Portunus trituberculatus]